MGVNELNFSSYLLRNERYLNTQSDKQNNVANGQHAVDHNLDNDEIAAYFNGDHLEINSNKQGDATILQEEFDNWYKANEDAISSFLRSEGFEYEYNTTEAKSAMQEALIDFINDNKGVVLDSHGGASIGELNINEIKEDKSGFSTVNNPDGSKTSTRTDRYGNITYQRTYTETKESNEITYNRDANGNVLNSSQEIYKYETSNHNVSHHSHIEYDKNGNKTAQKEQEFIYTDSIYSCEEIHETTYTQFDKDGNPINPQYTVLRGNDRFETASDFKVMEDISYEQLAHDLDKIIKDNKTSNIEKMELIAEKMEHAPEDMISEWANDSTYNDLCENLNVLFGKACTELKAENAESNLDTFFNMVETYYKISGDSFDENGFLREYFGKLISPPPGGQPLIKIDSIADIEKFTSIPNFDFDSLNEIDDKYINILPSIFKNVTLTNQSDLKRLNKICNLDTLSSLNPEITPSIIRLIKSCNDSQINYSQIQQLYSNELINFEQYGEDISDETIESIAKYLNYHIDNPFTEYTVREYIENRGKYLNKWNYRLTDDEKAEMIETIVEAVNKGDLKKTTAQLYINEVSGYSDEFWNDPDINLNDLCKVYGINL